MSSAASLSEKAPPPCAAPTFDLAVEVGDNVRGLSRILNVLALLDITPAEFSALEADGEFSVRARVTADGPVARLALQRLLALACVRHAALAARNVQAAPYLRPVR